LCNPIIISMKRDELERSRSDAGSRDRHPTARRHRSKHAFLSGSAPPSRTDSGRKIARSFERARILASNPDSGRPDRTWTRIAIDLGNTHEGQDRQKANNQCHNCNRHEQFFVPRRAVLVMLVTVLIMLVIHMMTLCVARLAVRLNLTHLRICKSHLSLERCRLILGKAPPTTLIGSFRSRQCSSNRARGR
jgi:hypothetical protein